MNSTQNQEKARSKVKEKPKTIINSKHYHAACAEMYEKLKYKGD